MKAKVFSVLLFVQVGIAMTDKALQIVEETNNR
jgi:hypothetical protein